MKVEVCLSPALYPYRTLSQHHTTVVVDLLRATTAICAAFQAGCTEVVPLDSLEALAGFREKGYVLAAERGGRKVEGATYGNSPTEYLRHDMKGVRLAYSTTNGTVTILRAAGAQHTYVGAFANLASLVDRLSLDGSDTVVLCSGWRNDFCIEDTLVAGAVLHRLGSDAQPLGDAAHMSLSLWREAMDDPYTYCRRCSHVHRLVRLRAEADIAFAFKTDTCPIVPELRDGCLIV